MDPDMVRQQEEAEAMSRMGRTPAARAAIAPRVANDDPIVLRAERRDGSVPALPATRFARHRPQGWGAALRACFFCLLLAAVGLVGGIMLGVKLGLIPEQSLAIGAGIGFLLGWQAAAASLRRRGLPFARAIRAAFMPTAIILIALIGGMAAASLRMDIAARTIPDYASSGYWLSVGVAALIGFILASAKMRRSLRRD
jgi:hypothetical protein